ncbi:Zn-ribbon domain-containing OB-fold protein [Leucobacter soli]|uniref:Zn-ribbon domain-containing OB-fold protein n=1 Tax=Leucobacter soli TaxID=2812850 RepID=UPI001C408A4E|nr:OB-fold domain-containing protein [Leucobacter soli]
MDRAGDIALTDAGHRLIGSCCRSCGGKNFPKRMACVDCGGIELEDAELAHEGRLYSHTTVHVSSIRETPYRLGYIDLTDGVRILAQLDVAAVEGGIDGPVELVVNDGNWSFTRKEQA